MVLKFKLFSLSCVHCNTRLPFTSISPLKLMPLIIFRQSLCKVEKLSYSEAIVALFSLQFHIESYSKLFNSKYSWRMYCYSYVLYNPPHYTRGNGNVTNTNEAVATMRAFNYGWYVSTPNTFFITSIRN